MKIVLRDDVDNLGKKGDLVEVRDGYARNYLVPRGLAITATRGVAKQSQAMRRNREVRDKREREAAQAIAALFEGKVLEVKVRAGEAGKLFGSVGTADVAAALHEQFGVDIERRQISGIDDPWKELASHEVVVKLHPDVTPKVTVTLVAQ